MSKKGKKSFTSLSKKSFVNDLEPWIRDSKTKMINDKEFQCSLTILLEPKPFYRRLTEEFDKFCQYGYRQCIKCISVETIKEIVFTNCSKNGEISPFSLLCDEILTKTGKYFEGLIPLNLYTYLIKYILLDYKEKRIVEKKLKELDTLEYESKLKPYVNLGGKSDTKGSKNESTKGGKDTKKDKNQLVLLEKVNTDLHIRNRNIRCLEDIKDEPEDGPDLYVILIQSRHSELPLELLKLDVPVTSLVQIGLLDASYYDDNESFQGILKQNLNTNDKIETMLKKSYLEINRGDKSFLKESGIRSFWNKILYYMNRKQYSHYFKNVDIMRYMPQIPQDPKSPTFIDVLRKSLYDGISNTVFNSFLLRKLHTIHIKEETIHFKSKKAIKLHNLNLYNTIMNSLTQEVSTVALILDSLVSQVCRGMESPIGYDIESYSFLTSRKEKKNSFDDKPSCLYKLIERLEYNNNFSDINLNSIDNFDKNHCDDVQKVKIFYDGDDLDRNSEYLDAEIKKFVQSRQSYIQKLFWDSLILLKVNNLDSLTDLYQNFVDKHSADINNKELFDVLLCLTYLNNTNKSDDPNKRFNICDDFFECYNGQWQNCIENIINRIPEERDLKILSDKISVLDSVTTLFTLQEFEKSFENSTHCNFYYVPINKKLLSIFTDRKVPLITTAVLPTILPLRDFINETSGENKFETSNIFLHKKRFNYSEMLYNKLRSTYLLDVIDNKIPDIICDSTKYRGDAEEWLQSYYDDLFEKRCKYKYFLEHKSDENKSFKYTNLQKPTLYNVNIDGKIEFNFFDMNIKLNNDLELFIKYLEANYSEKYDLSVLITLNNHTFRYRTNILPDGFIIQSTDKKESHFYIRHSSGIIFSFQKQNKKKIDSNNFEYPNLNFLNFSSDEPIFEPSFTETYSSKTYSSKTYLEKTHSEKTNSERTNKTEVNFNNISKSEKLKNSDKTYNYELNITWPNGLTLEHIDKPDFPHYVKQKYIHNMSKTKLKQISDEIFRCNLNNGKVIKFMTDGNLIILHGNGKVITSYQFKDDLKTSDTLSNTDQKQKIELTEIQETENNLISSYEVRHSDGRVYSVDDGVVTDQEGLFVEDFHDVLDCSITTEFSDGIVYKFQSDGSLVIKFNDGTIITSYTKFSDIEIEPEISESDIIRCPNQTIDGHENLIPFTAVEMTYKIDHPNYATTLFSFDGKSVILTMPHKIQVTISDNININFNEEVVIYNNKKAINVKQVKQKVIQNDIMFSFDTFYDRYEQPCVSVKDFKKNSILIYDNGKFEVNDNKAIGSLQNERLFVIDNMYSGFEILSKYLLNKYIKAKRTKSNSVVRQIINKCIIDHSVMEPIYISDEWLSFKDFLTVKKTYKMPSTYGTKWCHPFKANKITENLPEAICVKLFIEIQNVPELFKELKQLLLNFINECGTYLPASKINSTTNFKQLLLTINDMISNIELTLNNFKKGSKLLETRCEMRDSTNYIKSLVLYHATQGLFQNRIDKIKIEYENDKYNLLHSNIVNYFSSPEGEVFLILNSIVGKVLKFTDDKNEQNELDLLLVTPISNIGEKEMKRIQELLIKLKWNNTDNEDTIIYTIEKLLKAGKKLQTYFTNMNEVLEFHDHLKSGNIKICI